MVMGRLFNVIPDARTQTRKLTLAGGDGQLTKNLTKL